MHVCFSDETMCVNLQLYDVLREQRSHTCRLLPANLFLCDHQQYHRAENLDCYDQES